MFTGNTFFHSLYYEPPEFYANMEQLAESDKGGVAVASGWKVKQIDPYKKIAILDDGYEIKYDKCLVATGKPSILFYDDSVSTNECSLVRNPPKLEISLIGIC